MKNERTLQNLAVLQSLYFNQREFRFSDFASARVCHHLNDFYKDKSYWNQHLSDLVECQAANFIVILRLNVDEDECLTNSIVYQFLVHHIDIEFLRTRSVIKFFPEIPFFIELCGSLT
jgi:hypothetical protein